jgi:molybdopterin converting factor small subunit
MGVNINIHPDLQHFTGGSGVVEVQGNTVAECFDQLVRQFSSIRRSGFFKEGHLSQFVDVYLNGVRVNSDDLTTPTKDGDRIDVLILIAGG